MSVEPYSDQLWIKCNPIALFRKDIISRLSLLAKSMPSTFVQIIDSISEDNLKNYNIIVTDNILEIDYVKLSPELWGVYSYQSEYINRLPIKLFNCFINRACSRRQIWFYEFVRRNLLELGSVSYLLDHRVQKCSTIEEKQALFEKLYTEECGENFKHEHNKIKGHVPYTNLVGDLDQIIVNSKISIVIETYFTGSPISFSEKIFRALQLPRPILLYAVPKAVNELRKLGFELYDDIINHDEYDNISHPEERMTKILNILEDFKNFNYTEDTLLDFELRAQKNRDLLASFKQQWPDKLKKVEDLIKQKNL